MGFHIRFVCFYCVFIYISYSSFTPLPGGLNWCTFGEIYFNLKRHKLETILKSIRFCIVEILLLIAGIASICLEQMDSNHIEHTITTSLTFHATIKSIRTITYMSY